MMKFFRKHNKKLLAVFGVLLMIVFVGGGALSSLLSPGGDWVVAETAFKPISYVDQRIAQNTTEILAMMGQNWRQPVGVANKPLTETDWVLLSREANRMGTLLSAAAIKSRLAGPVIANNIEMVAHRLRIKPGRVLIALAELQSVQKAARAIAEDTSIPSEAEIRTAARDAIDKVKLDFAVLPASAFVDEGIPIPESMLEAHFEAYAEKEPGRGLHFGYYLPPSVQIQHIKVDRDVILKDISVANLERKARAYYDENRAADMAFYKPLDEPDNDAADEEEVQGPPTPPEYVREPKPYMEWEEASEIALDLVRTQHADEAAMRLAKWMLRYVEEQWAEAERDDSGYRVAPAECAEPTFYERVVERIPANIAYPEAVTVASSNFFSADQADEVTGIGSARFRSKRGGLVALGDLAFWTQGLIPTIPTGEDVRVSNYLAMHQTCQIPLTDGSGNVYLFRVVDTRDAHKAASLDEVRERVIRDVHLLRGFEAAKASVEGLMFNAASVGLRAAYDEDEALVHLAAGDDLEGETEDDDENEGTGMGFFSPGAFSRVPRYAAAYGRPSDGTVVPGGLGALERLPKEIVDQCFALEEADEKVALMELEDEATVLVVEWIETQRGREDEFEQLRERLARDMARYRSRDTLLEWLDPEKIRARNGFTPASSK